MLTHVPPSQAPTKEVDVIQSHRDSAEILPVHFENLEPRLLLSASSNLYDLTAASYIGGTASDDAVRGAVIQSDGTIVLAANISDASPGGAPETLLNGATAGSSGALIRLSSDGSTVLGVTRLADRVLDISNDSSGNLYVALFDQGFAKLNSDASSVLWSKTTLDLGFGNVQRIDAGPSGYVAVLGGGSLDSTTSSGDDVKIYDPTGTELGGVSTNKWKNDITIDESSQTVIYLGYGNRTDSASGLPVQVSYYRGVAYDGTIKYTGYDFSTNENDPQYLNGPTNNMADTRGYRAEVGDDGNLYMAFESAGGNYLFRYDPFDVNTAVTRAGGDRWNNVYNITSEHITVFGKFDPATGAYITGNEMRAVLGSDASNTFRIREGNIYADADGRMYLGGASSWGMPLETHPLYTFDPTAPSFNPGTGGNYLGGGYLVVMDPTLTNREFTTRLTGGSTRAIAARVIDADSQQIAFGGFSDGQVYNLNAVQSANAGGQDGWFGVIADSGADAGNAAPDASFTTSLISNNGVTSLIEFDATGTTDADDIALSYLWVFEDGTTATGQVVQKSIPVSSAQDVTLIVRDDTTGWSTAHVQTGPANALFTVSSLVGDAPRDLVFDASATTTLSGDKSGLQYDWDFGDGTTGTGEVVNHRYDRGGIYTATLTVTDLLGGQSTYDEVIGIAAQDAFERRLDFDSGAQNTEPGFESVPVALYDAQVGYGYASLTSDYHTGSYLNLADIAHAELYADSHTFNKYPQIGNESGHFIVDVPNGDYMVITRHSHKDAHTFPGLVAEGERVVGNIPLSEDERAIYAFPVTITDGQLDMIFLQDYWSISSLEIIDVGSALTPDPTNSFLVDPASGEASLLVNVDATAFGDPSLTYAWTFGDGNVGSGMTASNTYALPGMYTVGLTVSGASNSRIVDFGGDIVSSSRGISGDRPISNTDADNDGNNDDAIRRVDFGTAPDGYMVKGSDSASSSRVYGGIESIRIDAPTDTSSFSNFEITNNGSNDYINVRDQGGGLPVQEHRGLFLWTKAEFLHGGHAQRVFFDGSSNLEVEITRWESLEEGRFVVEDGGQFYVSQATFVGNGTHTLDPSSTLWAPYDPANEMDFDEAGAVYAAHTFTDIQSVGILLEHDGIAGGARVWYYINRFAADANYAPVSTTVTVVAPKPRVDVVATDDSASELGPDSGTYTFTRTGDTTNPLLVEYTIGGSASFADYTSDQPLTGVIEIPAGSATATLTLTPVDDLAREASETIELSLVETDDYFVEPPENPVRTITIADHEDYMVNFYGDYSTGFTFSNPGIEVADLDGDTLADDSRTAFAYDAVNPFIPIGPNYAGDSAEFFGGIVAYGLDSTSENFDTRSFGDIGGGNTFDKLSMRFQNDSSTTAADFDSVFFWKDDGFLLPGSPLKLGANSLIELNIGRFERLGEARLLLGDGTNFYVSDFTFGGGSSSFTDSALANSMWALYDAPAITGVDPTGIDIDFDEGAAVFDTAIDEIDVTRIGFITDKELGNPGRHWLEFDRFQVIEGDNRGATVQSVAFQPSPSSTADSLKVTFSEDIGDTLSVGDLSLFNDTAANPVDLSALTDDDLDWDADTLTATWNLASVSLTPGYYTATIAAAGITDQADNPLDGNADGQNGDDHVATGLYVNLAGDANSDGTVNIGDLTLLAGSFGQNGDWADGDFNGDGLVNIGDLTLLAGNFGTSAAAESLAQTTEPSARATDEATDYNTLAAWYEQSDNSGSNDLLGLWEDASAESVDELLV